MNYAFILVLVFTLFIIGLLGYLAGRYQSLLLGKIKALESQKTKPKPESPTVTMGAYKPPSAVSSPDNRSVGLVEPKTPERVAWEQEQAVEKEALGR